MFPAFRSILLLLCLTTLLKGEAGCHWSDPPFMDYRHILFTQDDRIEMLNQLVADYHALPKNAAECLEERIAALAGIQTYSRSLVEQASLVNVRPTLQKLDKLVTEKRNYLQALARMPADENIGNFHEGSGGLFSAKYAPIIMKNEASFSVVKREYWGKFWFEAMDPCHRQLAGYCQAYLLSRPKVPSYLDFFLWLETAYVPGSTSAVVYLQKEDLAQRSLVPRDGYLCWLGNGNRVTTRSQVRNLYVIELTGRILLAEDANGLFHSSLSLGRPVLGAGLVGIQDGIVHQINFESGHYRPDLSQGFQTLLLFKDQGLRFAKDLEIIYFEQGRKYRSSLPAASLGEFTAFRDWVTSKREELSGNTL